MDYFVDGNLGGARMDIVNNEMAIQIKEELLCKWDEIEKNIDHKINDALMQKAYWKFASDKMFHYTPYYHELNKFKKGRVLKSVEEKDRFSKRDIHSFGYNVADELVIMQHAMGDDLIYGIHNEIFETNSPNQTDRYYVQTYPQNNRSTSLVSIATFKKIDYKTWIEVSISKNAKNWTITYFIYETEEKIKKVIRHASGWGSQVTYNFLYDDNDELSKIMIGDMIWWKKRELNIQEESQFKKLRATFLREEDAYIGQIKLSMWGKENGIYSIRTEMFDENSVLTDMHLAAYNYLVEHQKEIESNVLKAMASAYPEWQVDYGYDADEIEEYMPNIQEEKDLLKLINLSNVYLINEYKDGIAYLGLEFECTWDDEHGLGVMMYKDRVVDIGHNDVATTSWIAEVDNS